MGDKSVIILRNHGGVTTGKTVCEAFVASFYLEKACQFQILAQSPGVPLAMPAMKSSPHPAAAPPATSAPSPASSAS